MKWFAVLLVAPVLCFAGTSAKTFTGVIHDNRCIGPNCATQCPVTKEPKYTLQSGEEAWLLIKAPRDRKTFAPYVGRKVIVTGAISADNTLKVTSITPAK